MGLGFRLFFEALTRFLILGMNTKQGTPSAGNILVAVLVFVLLPAAVSENVTSELALDG